MRITRIVDNLSWRKVFLLSAAFFILLSVGVSCKKKRNPVGSDALPPGTLMSSDGVDTFALYTYTEEEDSIVSMDPQFNLLGSYNDPVFGQVDAGFYTQITLSGFSPDFGDLNEVAIDSCVLAFEFGGYYGELSDQLFEVYEVTEELTRDSTYYHYSTAATDIQQLVPTANNEGLITPDPLTGAIVGDDTLDPQLRIPIDTTFARDLLVLASNSADDETFLDGLKGLHVKVNNGMQNPNEGGVFYLTSATSDSKLTVYYTVNGEQEEFDFIITNDAVDFNNVTFDYSGTQVEQVINDSTLGQDEYFAQSFVTRAKIDFPSIDNLPKDIIIHEATLELPLTYFTGDKLYPSSEISVSSRLFDGDDTKYIVDASVPFSQTEKSYTINLRTYVQNVLNGEVDNNGLFISPRLFNTTTERIIFNGSNTLNKKAPKLNIVYTKL
tara:strand:+ start:235177 stop:236493 length:1317 start_codon:yes stop_codon:yes gene_type:complete